MLYEDPTVISLESIDFKLISLKEGLSSLYRSTCGLILFPCPLRLASHPADRVMFRPDSDLLTCLWLH